MRDMKLRLMFIVFVVLALIVYTCFVFNMDMKLLYNKTKNLNTTKI